MQIWPAIDLLGGKAVRLTKGDYQKVTVYFDDPQQILTFFKEAGAKYLHVVDLDGAKEGTAPNYDVIRRLVQASDLQMEVGGGIRTEERINAYLEMGVSRVILGTAAIEKPEFLQSMVERYGEQIVVGVDAKEGQVAVHGWKTISDISGLQFCQTLEQMGVRTIIYTDIARDGELGGTNLPLYRQLKQTVRIPIIASGGITDLEEIEKLRDLGLSGAIIGKALYEGRLDLKQVLQAGGDQIC